jgi:hypothetical protein
MWNFFIFPHKNHGNRPGEVRLSNYSVGQADSFPATTMLPLKLFLDFVNHHPTRLIVRERLRMITVARMHPHTDRYHPATANPRFFDRAG